MNKIVLSWSSGKDSALSLYYLKKNPGNSIHLLTTINSKFQRVSMHGLRKELLLKQINSLEFPYTIVDLPEKTTNEEYESIMKSISTQFKNMGFLYFAFGDIFLQDIREYREKNLSPLGIQCLFPLWGKNSKEIISEFVNSGFESLIIAVNTEFLPIEFLGRKLDKEFLKDLPENIDPCGENGEFHTFCFNGPIFNYKIPFSLGDILKQEYKSNEKVYSYYFLDLF